jgi:hypothetical protein
MKKYIRKNILLITALCTIVAPLGGIARKLGTTTT